MNNPPGLLDISRPAGSDPEASRITGNPEVILNWRQLTNSLIEMRFPPNALIGPEKRELRLLSSPADRPRLRGAMPTYQGRSALRYAHWRLNVTGEDHLSLNSKHGQIWPLIAADLMRESIAIPFSNYNISLHGTTDVAGRPYRKGDSAYYSFVSTNFVKTSGIRLLEGRGFVPSDESSGAIAALVNEAFVKMFLSSRRPIGATLGFHRDPGDTDADLPFTQPMTVVGVVQHEVQGGDLGAPFEPMVYIDYLALPKTSFLSAVFSMSAEYAVRSALPEATVAAELRAVVKQDAPTMAEMSLTQMEEQISQSLG